MQRLTIAQIGLLAGGTALLMGMNLAGAEERPQVSEKALAVEHQNLRAVVDSPAPEEQVWDVEVKISASRPEPVETAGKPKQFYEEELIVVLKTVGFAGDSLRQAWAVAMKESTGNPKAHNQNANTGDNSYGLFQINMIGKLGPSRLEKFGLGSYEDLFDPYVNASIAYEMSKGGKDWGAWGIGPNAYNGGTTGSYYKWLEEYSGG